MSSSIRPHIWTSQAHTGSGSQLHLDRDRLVVRKRLSPPPPSAHGEGSPWIADLAPLSDKLILEIRDTMVLELLMDSLSYGARMVKLSPTERLGKDSLAARLTLEMIDRAARRNRKFTLSIEPREELQPIEARNDDATRFEVVDPRRGPVIWPRDSAKPR